MKTDAQVTWLTEDLICKVRNLFEPRYGRKLTYDEVCNIAENITSLFELILKQHASRMEAKDGE